MTPSPIPRLERMAAWWTGKAVARRQLATQATSDKERDEHHRLIGEYERRALAAGMQ
jgi:hypothetical protein